MTKLQFTLLAAVFGEVETNLKSNIYSHIEDRNYDTSDFDTCVELIKAVGAILDTFECEVVQELDDLPYNSMIQVVKSIGDIGSLLLFVKEVNDENGYCSDEEVEDLVRNLVAFTAIKDYIRSVSWK